MIAFPPLRTKIQYEIHLHNTSNPGYRKFAELVGTAYAFDALKLANEFAITTLTVTRFLDFPLRDNILLGKGYSNVTLSLESFRQENIGYPGVHRDSPSREHTRLAMDWQWDGPVWLLSGLAGYERLKAGYPPPKWASRGSGKSWDEGYAVTAYFLKYCNSLNRWFVAELNEKMKDKYSDNYFQDLLRKSVHDLWCDYKAVYQPLQYEVVANGTTQGDLRFKREVGMLYATHTLQLASEFALKVLDSKVRQNKPYKQVKLIVESFAQDIIPEMYYPSVAITTNNTIRLNSDYIQSFVGNLKDDITGVLYHESTRVWQWTGDGRAPTGLVNRIADYVRLKAGWRSRTWPKRGSGQRWNEGYAITAYFLEYLEVLKEGFVGQLNVMMKYYYTPTYFETLLGKDVDQLWKDYKSVYAAKAPSPAATAAPKAPPPAPAAAPKVPPPAMVPSKAQSPAKKLTSLGKSLGCLFYSWFTNNSMCPSSADRRC
ncbi:hypothetical protein MLD38_010264 [Melastoma candidum]|uniref:Uncharacterized protein n=1 Tax=Melastoma candidum TaxID=119954 RepID=A0ACB9R2D7_9MYRT|nr:hypothetical protein MLD38_010264 [Melastoma candidum]